MSKKALLLLSAALITVSGVPASAGDRYSTPPPLTLSQDLASPWLLQLRGAPKQRQVVRYQAPQVKKVKRKKTWQRTQPRNTRSVDRSRGTGIFAAWGRQKPDARQGTRTVTRQQRQVSYNRTHNRSVTPQAGTVNATTYIQQQSAQRPIDPVFLPRTVNYQTNQKPGTIIINTQTKHLYLVLGDGKARRYGVGVGKAGFEWSGSEKITRKAEWPSWRPPAQMIAREKKKGRDLPAFMEGGPSNPMGARALYLGSTLYRIHGTNQPWTIGQAVSSGCIRMRNEDVMELYERARIGAKVIVS